MKPVFIWERLGLQELHYCIPKQFAGRCAHARDGIYDEFESDDEWDLRAE